MDPVFVKMLMTSGTPEDFKKYLGTNAVYTPQDFALMAVREEDVKDEVLDHAKAAGVKFDTASVKISIRKLWLSCRKLMANVDQNIVDISGGGDACIPDPAHEEIKDTWKRLKGLTLPEGI